MWPSGNVFIVLCELEWVHPSCQRCWHCNECRAALSMSTYLKSQCSSSLVAVCLSSTATATTLFLGRAAMAHRMVLFLSIFSIQRTKLYLCLLFRGPFRPLHSWTSQNISSFRNFKVCFRLYCYLGRAPHPATALSTVIFLSHLQKYLLVTFHTMRATLNSQLSRCNQSGNTCLTRDGPAGGGGGTVLPPGGWCRAPGCDDGNSAPRWRRGAAWHGPAQGGAARSSVFFASLLLYVSLCVFRLQSYVGRVVTAVGGPATPQPWNSSVLFP